MLKVINLKNIALIKEGEIELSGGLNIFSGETGAGKSIIVDAMNFLLGAKADKSLIRHGETEAFVQGVFDIFDRDDIKKDLADIGIEEDETLVISRKMQIDGRNELRICGKVATISMLKGITSKIFDVHGQSEHFALSKSSYQGDLVDKFAKEGEGLRSEFKTLFGEYSKIQSEKEEFSGNQEERARQIDVYRFQVSEIEEAQLQEGEEEELTEKFKFFSGAEKLKEGLAIASECLGEEGVSGFLNGGYAGISKVSKLGDQYGEIAERFKNLINEAEDLYETCADALQGIDFDESEVDAVAERLDTIKKLKKKYGSDIGEIFEFLDSTKDKLEKLENAEMHLEKLEKRERELTFKIKEVGGELSSLRKEKACELANLIEGELHAVGMENAKFTVAFQNLEIAEASQKGLDKMEFMFSANLGEVQKPLSKIISGGEMSRFMLGMKNITASLENIDSMLFDEIDTGISGGVGHLVSEKFIGISQKHQVIAISHLPQIAASGEANFYIYKESEDGKTFTHIKRLSRDEKIAEVSRLSGGDQSAGSLEFAENLVKRYEEIHKQYSK